jgi:hypothetical protein
LGSARILAPAVSGMAPNSCCVGVWVSVSHSLLSATHACKIHAKWQARKGPGD